MFQINKVKYINTGLQIFKLPNVNNISPPVCQHCEHPVGHASIVSSCNLGGELDLG